MRCVLAGIFAAGLAAGTALADSAPAPQIKAEDIVRGLTTGEPDAAPANAGATRGVCFGTTEQCTPAAAAGGAAAATAAATGGLPSTGAPATGTPEPSASTATTVAATTGLPSTGGPPAPPAVNLLITFHFGSDRLTDQAMSNLREFARAIAMPELAAERFSIDGHTDAVGSDVFNEALSKRRADAVAAFLESLGVDRGRLVAIGHGERDLYDPARPDADINRRVEASIYR